VSERTVSRVLRTIPPSQTWNTFLKNHLSEIVSGGGLMFTLGWIFGEGDMGNMLRQFVPGGNGSLCLAVRLRAAARRLTVRYHLRHVHVCAGSWSMARELVLEA